MPEWLVGRATGARRVKEKLDDLCWVNYFPKYRTRRMVRGRLCWCEQWLFGQYFFAVCYQSWKLLFQIEGVTQVLMSKEVMQPYRVTQDTIDRVRAAEVHGFVPLSASIQRFKAGASVRVSSGPMSGFFGIYDGMGVQDREAALLDMFGRWTRIEFETGILEAVA